MSTANIVIAFCECGAQTFSPHDVIRRVDHAVAIEIAVEGQRARLERCLHPTNPQTMW
jgi:hypothetical protein